MEKNNNFTSNIIEHQYIHKYHLLETDPKLLHREKHIIDIDIRPTCCFFCLITKKSIIKNAKII